VDGKHYYGYFLKIFHLLPNYSTIYQEIRDKNANLDEQVKIYTPKYLSFVSSSPFFISFKYILEEIYNQSAINETKGYRIEHILNILLYRMYLPKYETTHLSWALNDKVYTFSRNYFKSEISFRLLFSYISLDKVVLLFIAFMMNSIIVFFHSNIDILAPILYLFMQLLHPFTANYSIINNLNPKLIELLGCPSANIVVGIYKNDFADLREVISLIRASVRKNF
jgi:hypothetical protein